MNWDQIQGNWKQLKGKARQKWGKLTEQDLEAVAGQHDQLTGVIQERYGMAKEKAEREIKEFCDSC